MKISFLPLRKALRAAVIFLLFALFCPFAGWCQENSYLTINEDADTYSTSLYVPFDGQFNKEQPCYSQFIIPASDLAEMQYGTIYSLTFYLEKEGYGYDDYYGWTYGTYGMPYWDHYSDSIQIYVAEVDQDGFMMNPDTYSFELYDWSQMTLVYDCDQNNYYDYVEITENENDYAVRFYISERFTGWSPEYEGGNLLIGFKPIGIANSYSCHWKGVSSNGAGWGGMKDGESYSAVCSNTDEWGYTTITTEDFKPKMTIEYYPGYEPTCPKPSNLTVDVQAHSATLSWVGDANYYNIQYHVIPDEYYGEYETISINDITETSYTLEGLFSNTNYYVEVQAVCDGWYYSDWKHLVFTTPQPLAPTGFRPTECDTPEGTTVTLEWDFDLSGGDPVSWHIAYTTDMAALPEDADYVVMDNSDWIGSGSYAFVLTGLDAFTRYKAWARADFGNGELGDWSASIEFKPTNLSYFDMYYGSSSWDQYVPFYFMGGSSNSQFIIPASSLTSLVGHEIWRVFFPYYNYDIDIPTNHLDVYMAEVDFDGFTSVEYYNWNDMEPVANQASIVTRHYDDYTVQGYIEFDAPFQYKGGNLLVGVRANVEYKEGYYTYSYGKTTANTPALANRGTSAPTLKSFLPNLGFYYSPETFGCASPEQLQVVVDDGTATLSWNCEGDAYRLRYWSMTEPTPVVVEVTGHSYALSLPQNTYYWEVQHLCTASDTSRYIGGPSFVTVTAAEPAFNDGTYEIHTTGELMWVEGVVNGTITEGTSGVFPVGNAAMDGLTVKLMNDLDLTGINWNPIGMNTAFQGLFDGGGHVIQNLYIERPALNHVGLMGKLGANGMIQNLGIGDGSVVHGNNYVGGIVGYNSGEIRNVYNRATLSGNEYVGGIVGYSSGMLYNVFNRGSVTAHDYWAGGIVGWLAGDLYNSYNTGIASDSGCCAGPICGGISNANPVNNHFVEGLGQDSENGTAQTQQYMQGQAFVNVLNAGQMPQPWKKDLTPTVNDGYPVLQGYDYPYHVVFSQPAHGTLTVKNGNLELSNGASVADNTVITIEVTPEQGYSLLLITANGEDLPDHTLTVHEDVEIAAVLVNHVVTDTTALACDSFDWHGHNYTLSGVYYDTLTSTSGIDSIIALHLTVGHSYHYSVQETVCDSLFWEDSLYTQSGYYERLYETVYGCDSLLSLNLTILHDEPIGAFTYLSPMDSMVNFMPDVSFVWDAVANAKCYDLYCWNDEEERPDVPALTGIQSTTCRLMDLENNITYRWCVVARNDCFEVESAERTFVSQITPNLSVVPQGLLDFADVEIGKSKTKTLSIRGVALDESIQYGFLTDSYGHDSEFFQIVPSNNWDAVKGGTLSVTFTPSNSQLYYSTGIRIVSGSFVDTVYFSGAVANRFVFSTTVEQPIYTCNDEILISGHVEDILGHPVAHLDVEVYLVVMGSRKGFSAVSDENGDYSVVYRPRKSEAGSYFVGSCALGAQSSAVHDAFDIPGMGFVDNVIWMPFIWEPYLNDTIRGTIGIRNRSSRPLSNIRVVPASLPDGCEVSFSTISLGSLESGYLQYEVTGTELTEGSQYEDAVFAIVSDEGVNMDLTCYYYCKKGRGVLDVYPPTVQATVDRTSQRVLSFQVTNNGNNETGLITIDIPDLEWMSVLGGNTLESLAVGDSCAFSIALSPDSNMELTTFGGSIAVNCANGNGVLVPFEIVVAESSTGTLVVDVTDDYTYNTNGGTGPHLANAQVMLTGIYSLDTIAIGLTDAEGLFIAEDLPEGYYWLRVSATDHKDYNPRVIYVEADGAKKDTNRQEVYLQFQAISYSWEVVPTEIEDVYDFDLICDIKTNVPLPVVVVEGPKQIGPMEAGDTLSFELTIKNYGLIDAYGVQLSNLVPDGYACTTMLEYIDTLPAKASVSVPCCYIKLDSDRDGAESCAVWRRSVTYWWFCNHKRKWDKYEDVTYVRSYADCVSWPNGPIDSIGNGYSDIEITEHPNSLIPWPNVSVKPNLHQGTTVLVKPAEDCTPCWKAGFSALVHLASDWSSVPIADIFDCYLYEATPMDYVYSVLPPPISVSLLNKKLLKCRAEAAVGYVAGEGLEHALGAVGKKIGPVLSVLQGLVSVGDRLNECVSWYQPHKELGDIGEAMDRYQYCVDLAQSIIRGFENLFYEEEWKEEENIVDFYDAFLSMVDTVNYLVSPQSAQQLKEACDMTAVNDSIIQCFIDRWNRGVQYWNEGINTMNDLPEGYDSLFVQMDSTLLTPLNGITQALEAYGYGSVSEMFDESVGFLLDKAVEHTNDVCAKVSVSFKQTMSMTREAFEGTLKIYNGHDSDPMENVGLNLVIKDETGVDCTELFQINVNSLHQITGADGTGTVQAQQEGVIQLIMIPTPAAAPTTPKVYSFGGSFSFLDPFSGEEMTYPLYPVQLTVNPSPELHVDYFIQRHLISDDPLTEDTIEATEPAELAMMVRNVGIGAAKNVYLESSQPEIVDNQSGLLIQFDMVGSVMNGEPRPLGLIDIPFGTLQPQSAGIAEWYFTSSLMARVLRSEPHFIHNNSYGNPDLSLVTELHSHELTKAIRAYGALEDGVNDFLVNETPDFGHIPDMLYFSHGGTAEVKRTINVSTEGTVTPEHRTVTLHLNPTENGWNYAFVDDPANGQYALVSCIRDDGQAIPLDNVWITHVTMFDDDAPVHENKLHILDTLAQLRPTSYSVEYAPDSTAHAGTEQPLALSTGWNWWSSCLEMDAMVEEALKDAIAAENTTATIKSMTGNIMLENGTWSTGVTLNNEAMFMLLVENPVMATLTASAVDPTLHTITLNPGWNWIGFPSAQPMALNDALAGITPNEGDVIKGNAGNATYTAEYGWNGSLTNLEPGRGYMYLNGGTETLTLTFPVVSKTHAPSAP